MAVDELIIMVTKIKTKRRRMSIIIPNYSGNILIPPLKPCYIRILIPWNFNSFEKIIKMKIYNLMLCVRVGF